VSRAEQKAEIAHSVRNILDSLPEFIVVLDRDGVIREVNEAWQASVRRSGTDSARVSIGANYLDVCRRASETGDGDAERALRGIETVLRGDCESFVMEYPCQMPDRKRFFLMHVKRLIDPRGGVVISHVDMTDRYRAEKELTRHNRRLDLLARVSQRLLLSPESDGRCLDVIFRDIAATLGFDLFLFYLPQHEGGDLVLRHSHGLNAADREALARVAIDECLCGEVARRQTRKVVEQLAVVSDQRAKPYQGLGATCFAGFPLVAGSKLLGVLAFASRTRSRFAAGEIRLVQTLCDQIAATLQRNGLIHQLGRSEARFRAAVEAVSSLMWTNTAEGLMRGEQPDWEQFTGQSYDQYQDYGWADAVHPDDAQATIEAWNQAVATRRAFVFEHRLRRRDGQWRQCSIRAVPVLNEDGSVLEWVGVHTDITESKRAEVELQEARHRAEAANEAKSIFLANMSHEIRSPMTAILGYIDMLEVHTDRDREVIDTIRRNSQHLLTLINDILDLSRIEAGKFQINRVEFSPRKLIEDVASLMKVRARDGGLELHCDCSNRLPDLAVSDAIRIRQILINLVGNAVKFTEDGSVRMVADFDPDAAELCVNVIDTGIGISGDQLSKLFGSFQQADGSIARRFGGSGLGLAISQRLADLLGGRIEVESELGRGSHFRLAVPLTVIDGRRSEVAEAEPRSPATATATTAKLAARVLVVDDRRDIRFLIQHLIEKMGGHVTQCSDGAQAVSILSESQSGGEPFDVVLMDMQMPVMDGPTAVRTLRDNGCDCPIVALTANAMASDREACLDAGYTDYLTKPIEAERLTELLHRLACQPPP
jgi:PAS domain S-box-containing protein